MKIATGVLALALTALPALVGRLVQMIHYHSLSEVDRVFPPEVIVEGMRLPNVQVCYLPATTTYHGTNQAAAIDILRWGFDPAKTSAGAKMADAVYVSARDHVSAVYGEDQLILSLDLKWDEVAYASDDVLLGFTDQIRRDLSDKKVMAAVRELYYQNGYRAIRYDLDGLYGRESAWAVYDPSCISITKIRPSPEIAPPARNSLRPRLLLT